MPLGDINIEELRKAYITVAQLVLMDRVYLPIVERLENEIATLEREENLIARARAAVNG